MTEKTQKTYVSILSMYYDEITDIAKKRNVTKATVLRYIVEFLFEYDLINIITNGVDIKKQSKKKKIPNIQNTISDIDTATLLLKEIKKALIKIEEDLK